ncbi:MAG: hypothetical protein ACI4R5_05820 [Acetatifactor sp.]
MKKILILSLITALLCMSACSRKAVEQDEPMIRETEQSVEPESSVTVQDKAERMEATENPDEVSGEPGSPETMEPEEQETDGLSGENAGETSESVSTQKPAAATSKPVATATPLPTATPQPTAVVSAVPTPEPHTSCTWDGGTVSTAAGCNSEGVKTFTCTVCGNTKTESIAAAGHSYTTDSKAATCTEPGYTKTYCTVCGDVQSETVQPATGHTLVEKWWYEPTCLYAGSGHGNKCINCDYYEDLPEYALGHEPDAGTVLYDSTYTTEGIIEHSCIRCGATLDDEIIPIKPHEHHWVMDEDGFTEYCDICYSGRE